MANFHRIKPEEIKLNMCFSAPVFFDDGKNMFLAPGKLTKQYHLDALTKWDIPFLLTTGKEVDVADARSIAALTNLNSDLEDGDDVEELMELEEL